MAATACPVAALAAEARAVTAALDRNEDEQGRVGRRGSGMVRQERVNRLLEDRRGAIEEAAAQRRATSAEGALFQLALVLDAAGQIESYTKDRHSMEVERAYRQVAGLVHSVARFLEREAGLRREEVFGDWYLSRDLDPHAAVDAALTTG